MLAEILDILKTITVHLLGQVVDQLDQALVPRGLYNDVMQCHIRLCDLFNVIGLHRRFKGIAGLFQIL